MNTVCMPHPHHFGHTPSTHPVAYKSEMSLQGAVGTVDFVLSSLLAGGNGDKGWTLVLHAHTPNSHSEVPLFGSEGGREREREGGRGTAFIDYRIYHFYQYTKQRVFIRQMKLMDML